MKKLLVLVAAGIMTMIISATQADVKPGMQRGEEEVYVDTVAADSVEIDSVEIDSVDVYTGPLPSGLDSLYDAESDEVGTVAVVDNSDTAETVTSVREMFRTLLCDELQILSRASRSDLLDYYDADTLHPVRNSMGGLSSLVRPVTDEYLKANVTPVSSMVIKKLPKGKKWVFMMAYTIHNNGKAADTQLSFWSESLKRLKTHSFIKEPKVEDFLDVPHGDKELKKELLALVPFPLIEYDLKPGSDTLHARLTSCDYMGIETAHLLRPYIRPELTYIWDGHKYKPLKASKAKR